MRHLPPPLASLLLASLQLSACASRAGTSPSATEPSANGAVSESSPDAGPRAPDPAEHSGSEEEPLDEQVVHCGWSPSPECPAFVKGECFDSLDEACEAIPCARDECHIEYPYSSVAEGCDPHLPAAVITCDEGE